MTNVDIALWVQVAAVLAAVGAAIVALVISRQDRENARKIAAEDRRTALLQGKLMFELEALLRLSQNLRRGGHEDTGISKDMGAEAGALIGAIGPERLPTNWDKRVAQTPEELRAFVQDETKQDWLRRAVEAQLALMAVSEELRVLIHAEEEAASEGP
jgi:hypothetical protein